MKNIPHHQPHRQTSVSVKIIAQFSANSKSSGSVTKNHQLRTVYKLEFEDGDGDGYYSDCTENSEGTYQFDINSVMFNTTADDSSGENVVRGSDLNVNAAAAKKQRPSILRNRKKKILKASEMAAGAVPKMMASKQMPVMTLDGTKVAVYLTLAGNMANIDYARCDSLVPTTDPIEDVHYKVNLLHSHEMEYRANLSNRDRDRVIRGKYLALVDGGANGLIIGLDMKILYLFQH